MFVNKEVSRRIGQNIGFCGNKLHWSEALIIIMVMLEQVFTSIDNVMQEILISDLFSLSS